MGKIAYLITAPVAARLLGRSVWTIYKLDDALQPEIHLDSGGKRRRLYSLESLDQFLATRGEIEIAAASAAAGRTAPVPARALKRALRGGR